MRITSLPLSVLVLSCGMFAVGCSGYGAATVAPTGTSTGGDNSAGGYVGSGGAGNLGGASSGTGGNSVTNDTQTTGGTSSVGGTTTTGGKSSTGGSEATGGKVATGGAATGGKVATGGAATGGFGFMTGGAATGGFGFTTGGAATGGAATGGAATSSTSSVNCSATALSGGSQHCSSNSSGSISGTSYTWTIWSSGSGGCLTTYSNAGAAFSATWNNSGDFLARVGLQWNTGKSYTQYGTVSADFAYTKTGSAGGYSYVGIYGWSKSPTIEYYIVEDSFNKMPVNPGTTTNKGTATIDGSAYNLYTRPASGASIDNSSSWTQFYSIRQTARQCGHISITQHFDAWKAAGMTLGSNMYEAKILVEAGGGSGSVSFTTASITAQ